jgi:hypothetical protein
MGGVLLVTFLSRQEKQLATGRNQSKPCIENNELVFNCPRALSLATQFTLPSLG